MDDVKKTKTLTLANMNDDACELPELTEADLASVTGGCAFCGCGGTAGVPAGGFGQPPFQRQF